MSWGSVDLERRPRPTLISGYYSSLCEGERQRKKSTQNQRQIGIEPEKQAAKEKKAREKRNIEVSTLHKWESVTQCGHFLLYLHPSQLLIWRKSPGWDHLDGVLLQSSGTKHTHRPLRRSINILLSQRYLCRILDWCLFPEGTLSDKALWWPLPKSVTNFCPLSQVHSQMCAHANTP